jgi:hypothetical protein
MQSVRNFRALSVLLVLALLFAAPWPVEAGPPWESPRAKIDAGPIGLLIEWFGSLLGDNGCTFDPNGGCRDMSGTNGQEAGCTFDPGGGCRDTAGSESPSGTHGLDNGCTFDPSGSPCRDDRGSG